MVKTLEINGFKGLTPYYAPQSGRDAAESDALVNFDTTYGSLAYRSQFPIALEAELQSIPPAFPPISYYLWSRYIGRFYENISGTIYPVTIGQSASALAPLFKIGDGMDSGFPGGAKPGMFQLEAFWGAQTDLGISDSPFQIATMNGRTYLCCTEGNGGAIYVFRFDSGAKLPYLDLVGYPVGPRAFTDVVGTTENHLGPAVSAASGTALSVGTYTYYITFANDYGVESVHGGALNVTTTVGNQAVTIDFKGYNGGGGSPAVSKAVALLSPRSPFLKSWGGAPYGQPTRLNVYRLNPGEDRPVFVKSLLAFWVDGNTARGLYVLDHITGGTTATTWTDTTSDSATVATRQAAALLSYASPFYQDDHHAAPSLTISIASDGQRMFALTKPTSSYEQQVYVSRRGPFGAAEHWQSSITIPDDHPENQAGYFTISTRHRPGFEKLLEHRGDIYLGGSDGIYRITGKSLLDYQAVQVTNDPVSAYSTWISCGEDMIWLSVDGFRASTGNPGDSRLISFGHRIHEGFLTTQRTAYQQGGVSACYLGNKYYVTTQKEAFGQTGFSNSVNFYVVYCYDQRSKSWREIIPTNGLNSPALCADPVTHSVYYIGNRNGNGDPVTDHNQIYKNLNFSTYASSISYDNFAPPIASGFRGFLYVDGSLSDLSNQYVFNVLELSASTFKWRVSINGGAFTAYTGSVNKAVAPSWNTLTNGIRIRWQDATNAASTVAPWVFTVNSDTTGLAGTFQRALWVNYALFPETMDYLPKTPTRLVVQVKPGVSPLVLAQSNTKLLFQLFGRKISDPSGIQNYTPYYVDFSNLNTTMDGSTNPEQAYYLQNGMVKFPYPQSDKAYKLPQMGLKIQLQTLGSRRLDDFLINGIWLEYDEHAKPRDIVAGGV